MMIAQERGLGLRLFGFALVVLVVVAACPAGAQDSDPRYQAPAANPRRPAEGQDQNPSQGHRRPARPARGDSRQSRRPDRCSSMARSSPASNWPTNASPERARRSSTY